MKPKILTRLANIVAKLAGSPDYDPSVKPTTPLEFYADRLPVVPFPSSRDDGKMLVAYGEGTYALVNPTQPAVTPEDVVSAFESMSDGQKETVMGELGVSPAPLVVTFSGTDENNSTCDKTWAEISAAIATRTIKARYTTGIDIYDLNVWLSPGLSLCGTFIDIPDPTDPASSYTKITCTIFYNNTVDCVFITV